MDEIKLRSRVATRSKGEMFRLDYPKRQERQEQSRRHNECPIAGSALHRRSRLPVAMRSAMRRELLGLIDGRNALEGTEECQSIAERLKENHATRVF